MAEKPHDDIPVAKTLSYSQIVKKTDVDEIPVELLQQLEEVAIPEICESDMLIAQLLQDQFNQEHAEQVKINVTKKNGLYKYKRFPGQLLQEPERETEQREDYADHDDFETNEREYASIPACGYKLTDGKIVTKHDKTISGRRNASKVMEFPPDIHTGDAGSFDMQLSNKVFNSLRAHSKSEQVKKYKHFGRKEAQVTTEIVIDESTRLLLFKLVNGGLLSSVNGVIATGKEAVIVHGVCNPNYTEMILPKECAIKIFKMSLNQFKNREIYIKDDYRFKQRFSKLNSRKSIHLWAEKEMHNLSRIRKLGLNCPDVIKLKKHVLVMSLIGENNRVAPQLKEASLTSKQWESAYKQVVDFMNRLFKEGHLIHADLSEYNILWHDSKCWFIDVSQSVEPQHANGLQFLFRDCINISKFFDKKGVADVASAEDLFESISGVQPQDLDMRERTHFRTPVNQVDQLKDECQETKAQLYPFEYAWEKSSTNPSSSVVQHDGLRDDFDELWKMMSQEERLRKKSEESDTEDSSDSEEAAIETSQKSKESAKPE